MARAPPPDKLMAMVGRGSGAGSASLVLTLKPARFHNSSLSAEFACSSRSLSSETNQQIPEVLPRRAHLRSFSCSLLPVRTELCLRARDEVGRRLPSCSQLPLQTMPSPKKKSCLCAATRFATSRSLMASFAMPQVFRHSRSYQCRAYRWPPRNVP